MPDDDTRSSSPTPRRRRQLVLRVAAAVVALGLGLAGGSWWYVTRSWFIIKQVTPQLEAKLGGNVQIGHARYLGDGILLFEDMTLRSPFQSGEAARVLQIGRTRIALDEGRLWHGEVLIKDVTLDDVVLRLSESAKAPGVFNYHTLRPDWSLEEIEKPELLPSVRINSAVIEVGEHLQGAYRKNGRRRVAGHMHPSPDGGGTYSFELGEIDENGVSLGEDGVLIKGHWNVQTLAHYARIDGLALDERALAMCPQMARIWWERMDLQGRVAYATVERTSNGPITVELHVDEVALTIPIGPKDFWVPLRQGVVEQATAQPRMRVSSGTIKLKLQGDRLTLSNLQGVIGGADGQSQIVGVPYLVNLTIEQLPLLDWERKEQWLDEVLESAPFAMSIRTVDFRLPTITDDATPPSVELPRQLAHLLAKFKLREGSLSTEVDISRAPPVLDDDGQLQPSPILTKGQAYISDARGAYDKFPYPLEDVDGYVQFDTEQVTVHYLMGKGSNDATVRISGTIAPPGNDAAVSLKLIAHDLPLDDRFRQALRPGERATFDALLHRPTFERLRGAGLLVDDAVIERARQDLGAARAALTQRQQEVLTDESQAAGAALQRTIVRLETLIEAGPFELGGRVDLDLAIDRPFGPDQPTTVTGMVTVQSADVLYDRFPYPIHVHRGIIAVQSDRISLGEGLVISTPGMGMGTAKGDIKLRRDDGSRHVAPDLQIAILGDELNDALFAAIPQIRRREAGTGGAMDRDDPREDRPRRIFNAIGLKGLLNYIGTISTNADDRVVFDFAVKLSQGSAAPTDELLSIMRDLGLLWPRGFSLDSVEGVFRVTPSRLELADVKGRRGDGRVTVSGFIGLGDESNAADITVRFDDLAVEKYIVNLAPGEEERRAAALWDRYQPRGTYDAELHYHTVDGKSEPAQLLIWPQALEIQIGDQPVQLARERGSLTLQGTQVAFQDLALRVYSHHGDDGLLVLNGSYGLAKETKELQLDGTWSGGDLTSPLITEIMSFIGGQAEAQRYARFQPSGSFDAQFTYHPPAGDRPANFLCKIQLHTIAFRLDDVPIKFQLDKESEIIFMPDKVLLRNIAGRNAEGTFRIEGSFVLADLLEADLELAYVGRIDGPQFRAFLPRKVRSTIDDLAFEANQPVRLAGGRLTIKQVQGMQTPTRWHTTFAGRLNLKQASFHSGIDFSEVDGVLDLIIDTTPDANRKLDIRATAVTAQALGRVLTNAEAHITLSDDRKRLVVDEFRAGLCRGVVTARATIGLAPASDYTLSVEIAGIDLEEFAHVQQDQPSHPQNGNGPKGELSGSLKLAGDRNKPQSRRGRGAAMIDGRIANLPLALRLLQLLELMPPVSGSLDFADAAFYITGDRVVFDRLSLECPTLQLLGEGEMDFNSLELDLQFRSRGTLGLVRDVVAQISDRLLAIAVTGTLGDPKATIVPLPTVRSTPRPNTNRWPKDLDEFSQAD